MKLAYAAIVGLGLLAAPSAFADPDAANGEGLYQQKCNMCHASGLANAPLFDKLTALERDKVVAAMKTPVPMMAGAVAGLSDEAINDIADYIASKKAG
jgi:mono/diheme cytochrome c family protein